MKKKLLLFVFVAFTTILCVNPIVAQNLESKATELISPLVESKSLKPVKLMIRVNGKVVDTGIQTRFAKIIKGGKEIVYSGENNSGSGGFENEGETVWIYNVGTKTKRKVLSQSVMIDAFIEAKLSDEKSAIVVRMSDGAVGDSHISVIDPDRGEVFSRKLAEVLKIDGNEMMLGIFRSGSWDYDYSSEKDSFRRQKGIFLSSSGPKPHKNEKYNLKKIIENNEVIYNEHTFAKYDPENEGLKRVEIYLWRYNDVFKNKNFVLSPVPRYVNPKAPLKPTLEALFSKVKQGEEDYGFGGPTFRMKFEGVVLRKETAHIKFSQPAGETNYGTLGPFIFEEAIKKTALQFPTVKHVRICAIGETLIDGQLEKPFPKCDK